MASWIKLAGLVPYDGRYELDLDGAPLTTREWGWVKRYAGYLPLTLTGEAFADPELIAVLAIVAVHRNGTIGTDEVAGMWDRLNDVPFGTVVTLEEDPAEDDAGPPDRKTSSKPGSSGDSSPTGSESSDAPLSRTGNPGSGTSVSVPVTSVR